jgi:hypothetical protein
MQQYLCQTIIDKSQHETEGVNASVILSTKPVNNSVNQLLSIGPRLDQAPPEAKRINTMLTLHTNKSLAPQKT